MQQHSEAIIDPAFTIEPAHYHYAKFTVPADAQNATVQGRFTASGGAGNDVVVFIFPEDDFVNWQNNHDSKVLYQSGQVTQASINAELPGPGTYYLVFSNNFSVISPKAVQADITINYTN